MATTAHEVLSTFVEQESTSGKFVGSKERVRIGLKSSHKSLNAFRNHVTTFCGIKDECVKRGLGESFDVKFCRLVKDGTSQPKAFSINTQEQWEVEMPFLTDSSSPSLLQGTLVQFYFLDVLA